LLKIEYDHTDYEEMLKHMAKCFNCKVKDGYMYLPKEYGEGYMRLISLPNGLQAMVSDYTLHQDVLIQRKKIAADFFTLRFDEASAPNSNGTDTANLKKDSKEHASTKSAVFLMSTKFDWLFLTTKGTTVKGVNLIFSREWLETFLGVEKVGGIIKKYLSLKMSAFNYEPLDTEYKRIMGEVINPSAEKVFETLVIQNRIMLLLERFFTRIYKKMSNSNFDVKISNDDLERLVVVETELVKDFSLTPPGIPKLARMAAMSPSKLKTTFREIYGLPIYQYYQKHRMNKAKAMLLSQKYNVKEVGMEVGYSNLSNFAKAFKKSFDQLPSDILNSK
jgi:AraC-like DNA-binding protein